MSQELMDAAATLERLQETTGGRITDLDSTGQKDGVENAETTCLALICLDCKQKGQF